MGTLLKNPAPTGVRGVHVAWFILTLAGALLIAEWSVRLALPDYDPAGQIRFTQDAKAGVLLGQRNTTARQIKNSGDYNVAVRINRHGFRDIQDVSQGTERDLYIVGDSFTFGWGVEENLRFSSRLAKLTGRRVFNISASVNIDSYTKLISYAESLGAGVRDVVIAINMIDDFAEILPPEATPAMPDALFNGRHFLYRAKLALLTHSAFYFALTTSLKSSKWLNAVLVELGLVIALKDRVWGAPPERAVKDSVAALSEISSKYRLTLMLIPSRGLWQGDKIDELAAYHKRVRKSLVDAGLHVVDLRPALEAAGSPLRFHFRNDGHWNPHGHAFAAEHLSKHLRQAR